MCAPRRRADSSSSRMRTAPPSPSTKPSRCRSKGRDACSGSSLFGDVALMASKQATVIGDSGASAAPATTTSAVPSRISCRPWPTASSPAVHPVEMSATGPPAPATRATSTAIELGTMKSYRCGMLYPGSSSHLRPPSESTTYSSSSPVVQPTALPMLTPSRSGVMVSSSRPLSAIASRAQTTPNCAARSIRRISCGLRPSAAASKSHSAAIWERNGAGSRRVIRRVALRPSVNSSQNALVPIPPGATTPTPVPPARRRSATTSSGATFLISGAATLPGNVSCRPSGRRISRPARAPLVCSAAQAGRKSTRERVPQVEGPHPQGEIMEFRILGPMEGTAETGDVTPTAPKVRQVLALLLLRCNGLVQTGEFIDELWGECPPRSALSTLQTYIYKLRKVLLDETPGGGAHGSEEMLRTKPSGYILKVLRDSVDVGRFERRAEEGAQALEENEPERAAAALSQALTVWRGPALADVSAGELLGAYATRLEESRMRALELRIEADLQLGRHHSIVGELKMLTATHRLHEGLHAKLMLALHRSGRRYEALNVYRQLREVLIEDLGLEPSPALNRIHRALLASDPALDAKPREKAAVPPVPPATAPTAVLASAAVPSRLPA